ncbi:hypothetical protein [Actinophytocola gossypii]|uniref:Uncharacterized protein n=1 Tax=Actinophytocola gossypii TaxID=2812003 RepID=A0ABT2JC65_9PSEU|nr:hypothetical protein [Actinophytocola gossypii]MCT2585465.1 hypothetical protein [Actinophytocola gossypii]
MPAAPIDHKRAEGLATSLRNDLVRNYEGLVEDIERPLTRMLETAVDATANADGVLDRIIPIDRHQAVRAAAGGDGYVPALDQVLGVGLSRALRRVLRRTPGSAWATDVSEELVATAGASDTRCVVLADALADRIREGCAGVRELGDPWAGRVAEAFQETATPLTTWHQPLTAECATALRLTALCLAAETGEHGADRLRATFNEIAAGVTFLQQRAEDGGPSTETIILAAGAPVGGGHAS